MTTIPLSGTSVRLISNTLFTNDYKHTRHFKTVTEQEAFFDGKSPIYSSTTMKFVPHGNGGTFKVEKNLEDLMNVTYMYFKNKNKTYYCFVTDLEYIDTRTTKIHFEIDVLQTYRFNYNIKPSYVVREHVNLYSGTTPNVYRQRENLDYGDKYNTVRITQIQPFGNIRFLVVATKQPLHDSIAKEITPIANGTPQGLSYYVHPFFASGTAPDVMVGEAHTPLGTVQEFLKGLFTQPEAVNNVVAIYVTDYPGLNIQRPSTNTVKFNTLQVKNVYFAYDGLMAQTLYVERCTNYLTVDVDLGDKYSGLTKYPESKIMQYPYTVYILTDLKGNQIEVRPEDITGSNLSIEVWGSMGTQNKVAYSVRNYHQYNGTGDDAFPFHEYNEGLISASPNLLPIINDYLSAFLQGNANSIQANLNSVMFNGALGAISNTLAVGGTLATGNIGFASLNAVNAVQTIGNTATSIQQINAQVKDASNIPPSISSQGSNTNFDYGHNITGVFLMKKQIKAEYINVLSDYFKLYGYKINRLKTPSLTSRSSWNYVELADANLTANIPIEHLNKIKSILMNGITFWHTNDIGNYSLDNSEV